VCFCKNYKGWPGLTGTGLFDLGLGTICAVDCGSDGCRDHGAAVDRTVDHGPRVHREPAKGVRPELICAIPCKSSGSRRLHAMERRRAARGAVRGSGPPETHWSWVDLELWASFCDTDRLYTERGTRRTRPGAPGGGSGGGQEPPRPAADGIDRRKAGDGTRHLECEQKRRRWPSYLAATLHVRSWRRGGSDGGD
jgi:hypothetical protein